MKILILNYEYPPLGGGTAVANRYLFSQFKKQRDLKIDLVTSSTNKYKEEAFSSNINIFRLNIGKRGKNLHHQTVFDLINYFIQSTVFTLKNRHRYDLVHAFSGLPGGVTAWLSGKPYIISLRGTEVPGYEARYSGLNKLILLLTKLAWKKARSVDANSKYLKQLALKTCPDLKIQVIKNGVDGKRFYPAKKLPSKPVILCNSRLGKRKGVKYLIKAIPIVLKSLPEAQLILIGEGVEKESLKRLADELKLDKQVKFLGQVEHQKLPVIYRKSSLFVLPSLSESLSNSLLEALACGLPVVATKVGGNPELVTKQNGILVLPADSRALAWAIIKLLQDKKLKDKIGRASLNEAQKYNWTKTTKAYINNYKNSYKNTKPLIDS